MSDRRTHIAKEILSTERTFVKNLRTIVDVRGFKVSAIDLFLFTSIFLFTAGIFTTFAYGNRGWKTYY